MSELFKYVVKNLMQRKLRSWLTMLGIFIGIAAIVSLLSLSQGLDKVVKEEFAKLGTDKVIIYGKTGGTPGTSSTNPLTLKDLDVVKKTKGVDNAVGTVIANAKVEYSNELRFFIVMSYPTDENRKIFEDISGFEIEEGRNLKKGDKYKVTLGISYFEDNIFSKNVKLKDKIKINGKEFKVIGKWSRVGNPQDDKNIYMTEESFREFFNISDRVDSIFARVKTNEDPSVVADRIEKNLRRHRGLKKGKEDFSIQTADQLIQQAGVIINIIQTVLLGIAAISLLVGGIGIMNTMYTAVLERTQEIGIMKAIGARNSDILKMFMIESGLLGLIGGSIGILIGMGIAKGIENIATFALKTHLISAYFPLTLILGSLLFSFFVGLISGILPAYQASRRNTIDALRDE